MDESNRSFCVQFVRSLNSVDGVRFAGGGIGSAHDEPTVVEEVWLTSQVEFNKGSALKRVVG